MGGWHRGIALQDAEGGLEVVVLDNSGNKEFVHVASIRSVGQIWTLFITRLSLMLMRMRWSMDGARLERDVKPLEL